VIIRLVEKNNILTVGANQTGRPIDIGVARRWSFRSGAAMIKAFRSADLTGFFDRREVIGLAQFELSLVNSEEYRAGPLNDD
jgi:hypothetical protein